MVGVPAGGYWKELLNSDGSEYGGSGLGNMGGVEALAVKTHGRPYSLRLTLPPLGALFERKPNAPHSRYRQLSSRAQRGISCSLNCHPSEVAVSRRRSRYQSRETSRNR